MHRFRTAAAWGLVLMVAATGCRGMYPWPPGSIAQQQFNASVHDPYTDNDIGPEVVGGRPRGFQKPSAEPVRNRRLFDWRWGW